jgi:hypothetical protein
MKTRTSSGLLLTLTITAALVLAARTVPAQDSTTSAGAAQTAPVQLSYGVSQIIQLSQAKVGDDTIVNYIRNSGSSYGLDANQIVYLKQQGVSDAVINTMLSQPRQGVQTTASPPAYPAASSTVTATVVAPPAVTYVQPASTVYVVPDTQTYNYYAYAYRPYYGGYYYYPCYRPSYYYGGCYPSVSFAIGFGGGYRGGYYRGGWGGYHGGSGWHH